MYNPQMINIDQTLESQESDVTFDEIIFKLVCQGDSKTARIFTKNYLKNFYKVGVYPNE